ncbi:unnamed protein product [Microthlaspi erraticum]|uniref:Integrase catalytic domain-containing protein n=1 Tax=Microthlaspi erraticum TaxID=1685480 RepID=A0A6D2KSE1_9BRAS|nr:unnamed protein product [Microthlaspi erraticum]CAA7057430.1 unnamed protein product [Microthlaspi erraticum]
MGSSRLPLHDAVIAESDSYAEVYSFKMQDAKIIDQNVDDFLKLIVENLKIDIPEETIGEGHFARGRNFSRNTNVSEGHLKKQCYKWQERNKGKGYSQDSGESCVPKDGVKDLLGLLVAEVNMSREEEDLEEWIMDIGCSFHMTPRRDIFLEFKELSNGKVRMANDSLSEVKGIGSVRFKNHDGTTFVLNEVRYMQGISKNLMSMGTLESKGCELKRFWRNPEGSSSYQTNAAVKEDKNQLWNSRLGHIGQNGLDLLGKKGCFGDSKVLDIQFCEDCVKGKTHKVSFGPVQYNTRNKIDYIHSDFWGAPNVPHSLSKCQYFISLTDDYSRKFNDFWKDEGVVRHKTCAYTSQQNGVAQRLNRTIKNKVWSMLSKSVLSQKFWAEAISTVVFLINRSPSSIVDFAIPKELWTSVMPSLMDLKRFGCVAYVHSSDGKLNPRAKKGIFTGYPEGVKSFKL